MKKARIALKITTFSKFVFGQEAILNLEAVMKLLLQSRKIWKLQKLGI